MKNKRPWLWFLLIIPVLITLCLSLELGSPGNIESGPRPTKIPIPTPTFTVFDQLDFVTYPDNYKGAFIQVRGVVHNINSDTELQIYLEDSSDSVYITSKTPYEKIYEDDTVIVTGYVYGKTCGTNIFGATICLPEIEKAIVTKTN